MKHSEIPPHVPVVLAYEHEYRKVYVTRVWTSRAGERLVTGVCADKMEYRTFKVSKIKGKIHILKDDHEVHPSLSPE